MPALNSQPPLKEYWKTGMGLKMPGTEAGTPWTIETFTTECKKHLAAAKKVSNRTRPNAGDPITPTRGTVKNWLRNPPAEATYVQARCRDLMLIVFFGEGFAEDDRAKALDNAWSADTATPGAQRTDVVADACAEPTSATADAPLPSP